MAAGSDMGLGLRYLRQGSDGGLIETIFGSSNSLSAESAAQLRRRLLGSAPKRAASARSTYRFHPAIVSRPPEQVPLERKMKLLQAVDKTIRKEFPHIRQVSLTYAERRKQFAVLNSDGLAHGEERVSLLFAIRVTAEKDGVLQTGYEVIGGLKGYELLDDFDPIHAGRLAAGRAVSKLAAPPAKAGEMPVILASSAGGTFVHEAIGHSLEADHVQEGTSPAYRGKLGQTVAPEFIRIIDDPTLPFYRGSYGADDEGTPAAPTTLVEGGVLKGYLYDRLTAMKDKVPSNGHGRRESYHHKPIPRMSNLYIAPGKDDPKRIIEELDRGLLVTKMGGGQVDTATGEFVFEVEEGFLVEGGKVRHQLRDANLLGVGPTVLKSIDRLGWDIGWGIGTCGKDGQGVPVSDGQPTLRIPKLLVGGRQDGA
jgi:TldD protein